MKQCMMREQNRCQAASAEAVSSSCACLEKMSNHAVKGAVMSVSSFVSALEARFFAGLYYFYYYFMRQQNNDRLKRLKLS